MSELVGDAIIIVLLSVILYVEIAMYYRDKGNDKQDELDSIVDYGKQLDDMVKEKDKFTLFGGFKVPEEEEKEYVRKTHVHLSDEEKDELYAYAKRHPSLKNYEIAAYYGIAESTTSRIISSRGGR